MDRLLNLVEVLLGLVIQRRLIDFAGGVEEIVERRMLLRQADEYFGIAIERLQVSFGDTAEERILALGFVDEGGGKQAADDQPEQGCDQESLPKGKPAEEFGSQGVTRTCSMI
jgi:hypothetical protein